MSYKMDKDGEDWHVLETKNLKNLGYTFPDVQTVTSWAPLSNISNTSDK